MVLLFVGNNNFDLLDTIKKNFILRAQYIILTNINNCKKKSVFFKHFFQQRNLLLYCITINRYPFFSIITFYDRYKYTCIYICALNILVIQIIIIIWYKYNAVKKSILSKYKKPYKKKIKYFQTLFNHQ